jgi:hypothetical protein
MISSRCILYLYNPVFGTCFYSFLDFLFPVSFLSESSGQDYAQHLPLYFFTF